MTNLNQIHTDVLIIGSGLSGIRAALEANKHGVITTLVTKTNIDQANSFRSSGGFATAYTESFPTKNSTDCPEVHYNDTLRGGYEVNDRQKVWHMVNHTQKEIKKLESYGVTFLSESGEHKKFRLAGHTQDRSIRVEGGGMKQPMSQLVAIAKKQGVNILTSIMALDLGVSNHKVCGLLAVDKKNEQMLYIHARSVVFATGGAGRLFSITTNISETTGDGFAIALRAGIPLKDMEFIQFTPTALASPKEIRGFTTGGMLLYLSGAKLLNVNGERFMKKYNPDKMEQSTRDIIASAIYQEIQKGNGTASDGVYLDLRDVCKNDLISTFAGLLKLLGKHGIDPLKDKLEISPSAHHFMGGISVVNKVKTNIVGVYAAGEVTAGLHGANRLNSNALPEANVFGSLAGDLAGIFAQKEKQSAKHNLQDIDGLKMPLFCWKRYLTQDTISNHELDIKLETIKRELQTNMMKHVSLNRNGAGLGAMIQKINEWQENVECLKTNCMRRFIQLSEIKNMLTVAEIVVHSARMRKESRGAHVRSDFPETNNDRWLGNIIVTRNTNGKCIYEFKKLW